MFTGKSADTNVDSTMSFPSKTKPTPGVELSFPGRKEQYASGISYFRTQGSGNTNAVTPPIDKGEVIWGANLNPGD